MSFAEVTIKLYADVVDPVYLIESEHPIDQVSSNRSLDRRSSISGEDIDVDSGDGHLGSCSELTCC